jgi:energy-coupling factor transporter ATP-binding protein EcfA2
MEVERLLNDCGSLSAQQGAHLRKNLVGTLIMHRNLKQAFMRLHEIIELGKPGQIVVLCGPTNVGKTTAVKTMDRMLIVAAQKKGLPVWGSAYCRLPSPVRARFDEGETYRRTLNSLEEPLIDAKVEYPDIRQGAVPRRALPQSRRPPTHAALWAALVNRVRAGLPAVFFDEAGELPQSLKVCTLRETVNLFKQLADIGGSCAVLVSGPEIGPILWESGQVAARKKLVGIDPYNHEVIEDVKVFSAVMKAFEANLGADYIEPGTLCPKNAVEMMPEVRGTIGIAFDTVVDAANSSLLAGNGPLSWSRLSVAVNERMDEIGTMVDQEQELWEGVKNEEVRGRYWGIAAAAGFYGKELVLPLKDYASKHEPEPAAKKGPSSKSKSGENLRQQTAGGVAAGKVRPAKRGMHPTTPKRIPLGQFKVESEEVKE